MKVYIVSVSKWDKDDEQFLTEELHDKCYPNKSEAVKAMYDDFNLEKSDLEDGINDVETYCNPEYCSINLNMEPYKDWNIAELTLDI